MFRKPPKRDPHHELSDALDRAITDACQSHVDKRVIANLLEAAGQQLRMAWACSAPVL
jgi:hypothetical protein